MIDISNVYLKVLDDALERSKSLIAPPPTQMVIELTCECNLKCNYCTNDSDLMKRLETIKLDIREIYNMSYEISQVSMIIFAGTGEPISYKYLFDIIRFIRKHNKHCNIVIATNGTIMSTEEDILFFSENKLTVSISLDSIRPEIQRATRPNANSIKVMKHIEFINEIKQKHNLSYPVIAVSTVVTKNNVGRIKEISKFVFNSGGVIHNLLELMQFDENNDFYNANKIDQQYEIDKIGDEIRDIAETYKDRLFLLDGTFIKNYPDIKIGRNTIREKVLNCMCLDPWIFGYIHITGAITPCAFGNIKYGVLNSIRKPIETIARDSMIYFPSSVHNEVYKGMEEYITYRNGTFLELWNGEAMIELRNQIQTNDLTDECKECMKNKKHNTWFSCS